MVFLRSSNAACRVTMLVLGVQDATIRAMRALAAARASLTALRHPARSFMSLCCLPSLKPVRKPPPIKLIFLASAP